MLIFNFEIIDDFLKALKYRIVDEVFSEYLEPETSLGASPQNHKLILQFIGRPDEKNTSILALYQIRIRIKQKNERNEIINHLQEAFAKVGGISLIQGNITEIFQSIS